MWWAIAAAADPEFEVSWTVVTVGMAPCPLETSRREAGSVYGLSGYSMFSCAVLHTQTTRDLYKKMFNSEDAAEEFIAGMPICGEWVYSLGECIQDIKRSWLPDKEQLEEEAAEQALIDSKMGGIQQ